MTNSSSNSSGKGVNNLLVVFLILALLGCGILAYLWRTDLYKNGVSVKEQNEELAVMLEKANISKDSLDSQLNVTLSQYQKVLEELSIAKDENSTLITSLENKKIYIRRLINRPKDPRALLEAKAEIERLKKELVYYRVQVDTLSKSKEILAIKYNETNNKYSQTKDEIKKVKGEKENLQDRLNDASLAISDLGVVPSRLKRGENVQTEKAKRVDLITISLTLKAGELIEKGDKELIMRLLGTNGEVLGADNHDALMDSDKLVSMKENVSYQGEELDVKFKFKQKAAYKAGTYTIEIFSEGNFVARTLFNLE